MCSVKIRFLFTVFVVCCGFVLVAGSNSVTTNGTEVTITTEDSSAVLRVSDVYGPEITKLIKDGAHVAEYYPSEPATYGALEIQRGQFRVKRADQLGAGDVTLLSSGVLMIDGADVTVPSKVWFNGTDGYVSAFNSNDACIGLTSVGSTNAEGSRSVIAGRTGLGYSKVRFSLTGADNEAMDRLLIQGKTDVSFDGGTVKVASTALKPFVQDRNKNDPACPKAYSVGLHGVTVDVAGIADVPFGPVLTFVQPLTVTNLVETYLPSNHSFEDGKTDWTLTNNTKPASVEYSSVQANGAAFDTGMNGDVKVEFTTTNGTHYAMVRRTCSLSRSVDLPTAGLWRLCFEVGCRPIGSYSLFMTTTVKIDGETVLTIPELTQHGQKHTFQRVETPLIDLAKGTHTLSVELNDNDQGSGSLNFDCFVFDRFEEVTYSPSITKAGAGLLTMEDQPVTVPLSVDGGTLNLKRPSLANAETTVEDGATLVLEMPTLAQGAVVSVAAGGRLELTDMADTVIKNGSFEGPAVGNYSGENPDNWSRSLTDSTGTYQNQNGAGYQHNGGTMCGIEDTSYGVQTAYLRNYTKLEQALTDVLAGIYRLTFIQSVRKDYEGHKMRTSVKIDGNEVFAVDPVATANYPFSRFTTEITLTAGDHTLSFDTTGNTTQQGAIVLIDDVRLERVEDIGEVEAGEIRMASGSTLVLDNAHPIAVKRFLVDGHEVKGKRRALEQAGITVEGDGVIRVGEPFGMVIILR